MLTQRNIDAHAPTAVRGMKGERATLSPLGDRLALICRPATDVHSAFVHTVVVKVFEVVSGKLLATMPQAKDVLDLAWSKDGQRLTMLKYVSAHQLQCQVCQVASGACAEYACTAISVPAASLWPRRRTVSSATMRLSPFGEFLTVVQMPTTLHVLSTQSGEAMMVPFPLADWNGMGREDSASLVWNAEGHRLACSALCPRGGQLEVVHLPQGDRRVWHLDSTAAVDPLAWSADGRWLAGRRLAATVGVWQLGQSSAQVWVRGAADACFSADSRLALFACAQDRCVLGHSRLEVWDLESGTRVARVMTVRQHIQLIGSWPCLNPIYYERSRGKLIAWQLHGKPAAELVGQYPLTPDALHASDGLGMHERELYQFRGTWTACGNALLVDSGDEVCIMVFSPHTS